MKNIFKNFIAWLATTRVLAVPRKIMEPIMSHAVTSQNGALFYYNDAKRSKVIELVRKVKEENEMLLFNNEAYQIYMATERTGKIEGDIAELGSYRGGSAKLICEAKGEKKLHLFDTFSGLPDLHEKDDGKQFHEGQFSAELDAVKDYLKEYNNVYFYKGLFPNTADPIKDKKFSFVHLDLDLYEATLAGVEFFYPRMNRGGIIISHDYITSPGVREAIDGFFKDKPEPIIEMSGSQCLIVKL